MNGNIADASARRSGLAPGLTVMRKGSIPP